MRRWDILVIAYIFDSIISVLHTKGIEVFAILSLNFPDSGHKFRDRLIRPAVRTQNELDLFSKIQSKLAFSFSSFSTQNKLLV